jgi:hypothetical protein
MRFVCDAAGRKTWFGIETEAEAARESELMRHAVEKHFRRAHEQASQAYRPRAGGPSFEQDIGRAGAHPPGHAGVPDAADGDGDALATRDAPASAGGGADNLVCSPMVVGPGNADPTRSTGRPYGTSAGIRPSS